MPTTGTLPATIRDVDAYSLHRLGVMRAGRCKAHLKRNGAQCGNKAVLGTTVCRFHGGATPQAMAMAKKRMAAYIGHLVDPDQVLYELACIAYADIRLLYDDMGQILPVTDWPAEVALAVASTKTLKMNLDATDGEQQTVVEVKMYDKFRALESLATHLQLLNKKLDVTVEIDVVKYLQAGRERVARFKADQLGHPPVTLAIAGAPAETLPALDDDDW